jgi:predicted nucleic acid-binding protein
LQKGGKIFDTERLKSFFQENVVLDNNILIDFIEIKVALNKDYLKLLNKLFRKIIIPTPIIEEELCQKDIINLDYKEGILSNEDGYNIFINLGNDPKAKQLSEYDRYVIAIAYESQHLVASNDKPVREICNKYNIKVTGTLGIVSSLYENNIITLKEMKKIFVFLFSDSSSCFLSKNLKQSLYIHYEFEKN